MNQISTFFFFPGGEPGGANNQPPTPAENETTEKKIAPAGEDAEAKTMGEKIKEALQDWSNKD